MIFLSSMSFDFQGCVTVFPLLPSENILPKMPCNLLQAVTYSKDWDSQLENCLVDIWRIWSVNGIRPTGEHDTFRFPKSFRYRAATQSRYPAPADDVYEVGIL